MGIFNGVCGGNVVQQATSDFGRVCFDGRECVDGNLHGEQDRRKRDLSKLSMFPFFFLSFFCAAVVFLSLVAVLVKKVEVTQVVRVEGYGGNGISV
jgi:hypothetical protein